MSFLRTSLSVLAAQTLIAPVTLLTGVVLARGLPVYDRGLYAAASEFAAILVIAIELGWDTTVIYRISRIRIPPARVAGAALWVCLVVSAIAVASCLALQDVIRARFISNADPRLLHLALAAIPFELVGLIFAGVARGLGHFELHNGYRLGTAVLLLAGTTTAILLDGLAISALAALLAAHAISATVLVLLVLRRSGLELGIPIAEIRQSLRFGFQSHIQQILMTLHQRIDILLIAWLAGDPETVAVYAVAVGIINRVRILPMSIALAMFPTITGQTDEVAGRFVAKVSRFSIALVVLTAAILAPVAPFLVPLLFGEQYVPSVAPLLVLLPAAVFLTPALILTRYFAARAQQPKSIAILLAATALNVGLNLIWIPRFGALGAAAASVASYGLQFALMLIAFLRESGRSVADATVVNREDLRTYSRRFESWWLRKVRRHAVGPRR